MTAGRLDVVAEPIQQGRTQQLWQVLLTRSEDGKLVARGQVRLQNVALPGGVTASQRGRVEDDLEQRPRVLQRRGRTRRRPGHHPVPPGRTAVRQQLAALEQVVPDDLAEQQARAVLDRQADRVPRLDLVEERRQLAQVLGGPLPGQLLRQRPELGGREAGGVDVDPRLDTQADDARGQAGAQLAVRPRPHHPDPDALGLRRRRDVVRVRPDVGQVVGFGPNSSAKRGR